MRGEHRAKNVAARMHGSRRSQTISSLILPPGRLATEETVPASGPDAVPRVASEEAAGSVAARGVRVSVIRLPPTVHGDGDHGFVPRLIALAREKGISAFVGEGQNRWPAVHRLDAAHLYRLVLEKGDAGARYHGVAEEGVPFREIAGVIGRRLNRPVVSKTSEEAASHFGWFAHFAAGDLPVSSQRTQQLMGWQPKQPRLIPDLDRARYFEI